MNRADAFVFGMLTMYALCGVYIGWMLPVHRRGLSMLICAAIWPLMAIDIKWTREDANPEPRP